MYKKYKQGDMDEATYNTALEQGYYKSSTDETLYTLDADQPGDVQSFEYENPAAVIEFVGKLLGERWQQTLQDIAEHAINS